MRIFVFMIALFCFVSCSGDKMPADILPQKKMQDVLWDLMRADEYLINYAAKDSGYNKKDRTLEMYGQIYRIHKTSKEQVEKSLFYYNRKPAAFKIILDSLEKRKTHLMEDQYKKMSADSSKKRIRLGSPK